MEKIVVLKGVFIGLGVLYLLLGILMQRCGQNWILGVRTKWALNDKENWIKSNKLCGKLMMVSAILLNIYILSLGSIENFNSFAVTITFIVLLSPIIAPIFYSYYLHKKIKK